MIDNQVLYNENPYEEIEWTDGDISSHCSKILYQYNDYARYYAFAYTSFDFEDFVQRGFYRELGAKADNVSSFVCVGNHNMCICLLNAESRHVVRQISINYFMIKEVDIDEQRFETIIDISLDKNYLRLRIPNKAIGTKLQYQKTMKEKIVDFLSNIDKLEK